MLEDLFNDIETLTKKLVFVDNFIPVAYAENSLESEDVIYQTDLPIQLDSPHNSTKVYEIIEDERVIIIGKQRFYIDDFFNLENLIKGDYKTVDYVLTNKGFDIRDFIPS